MAYYRPIYDPREEAYLAARTSEHQFVRQTHVRAATIVPNYTRFAMARGMYSELNNAFNEVCPPTQVEENMFQHLQNVGQNYPQQYSSPIDSHNQHLPVVPFGVLANEQRSFSPGMSGSSNDIRGMGIPSHVSTDADARYSSSPRDLTSVANRPDLQWMVTTSNIDMRTVTPPNSIVTHPGHSQGISYNSSMPQGTNSSTASISHSGYNRGMPSSSMAQKNRGLTKSGKPRGTPGRKRKVEDHDLTPEEASKRHLRRERNKLAAAKCRNRRRELTDRLQGETDILEDHQGMLTQEIVSLQQEKDHLEFILASHTPICKVLQTKSMNIAGNQSPKGMHDADCMGLHNHGANLVPPMDVNNDYGQMHGGRLGNEQATTVSVIQAGPSLTGSVIRSMNENIYPSQNNSVIVGGDSMMHGQSYNQAEDLRTPTQRRFPASLASLDVLEEVVSGEPLNTPVCTLSTPSNTTAVFTFPNTTAVTNSSMANSFPESFSSTTSVDYCQNTGSVMSSRHFLHPSQGSMQYNTNSSQSVITSGTMRESCAAAHRRNSSSESHQSPDSVQSPTLLSL